MSWAVGQTPIKASARIGERAIHRSEEAMEWRPARRRQLMATLRRIAITWAAGPRPAWWSSSKALRPSRTARSRFSIPLPPDVARQLRQVGPRWVSAGDHVDPPSALLLGAEPGTVALHSHHLPDSRAVDAATAGRSGASSARRLLAGGAKHQCAPGRARSGGRPGGPTRSEPLPGGLRMITPTLRLGQEVWTPAACHLGTTHVRSAGERPVAPPTSSSSSALTMAHRTSDCSQPLSRRSHWLTTLRWRQRMTTSTICQP